jgi:bifunctional NMN adenylyltransferase/nudix hydrolase
MATNVGVIIGRFQVDDLHPAHRAVIDEVKDKHTSVLLFLGVPATYLSQRNPLDFATRRRMIQSHYPDIEVLTIKDHKVDKVWYQDLDHRIREVEPHATITLYGGRDSFISHYDGQFKTEELDIENSFSGTEVRERVGNNPLHTVDFRAGVIYAIANRHPISHPTVDIALVAPSYTSLSGKSQILLGRKHGDKKWCFPGGFLDNKKDKCFEDAARRELHEETNYICSSDVCKYVLSKEVEKDWRYAHETDRIFTSLFQIEVPSGSLYLKNEGEGLAETGLHSATKMEAGDDLEEIQWFDLETFGDYERHFITNETITDAHVPLMVAYIQYLKDNELYGLANDKPKPQDCD